MSPTAGQLWTVLTLPSMRTRSLHSLVTTEQGKPPPCKSSKKEDGLPPLLSFSGAILFLLAVVYPFPLNFSEKNMLYICVSGMSKARCNIQCSLTYVISFDPHKKSERELQYICCPPCVPGKWTSREWSELPEAPSHNGSVGAGGRSSHNCFWSLTSGAHPPTPAPPLQHYCHWWRW